MFLSKATSLAKVAIILFLASVSNAQVIDFDLSNYNPPEFKRHSLDTELGLYGGHSLSEDNFVSESSDRSDEEANNSFSFDGSALYSTKKHSTFLQRSFSADFQARQSYSKSTGESEEIISENTMETERSYSRLVTSLTLKGSNRYYFQGHSLFFETNAALIPNFNFSDRSDEQSNRSYDLFIDSYVPPYDYNEYIRTAESEGLVKTDNTVISISFDPEIIAGYGRINEVSDARLAVYIYQDLQDKNCLDRTPAAEDIVKLAELITEIKNERFFDARDKKISDITRIDIFLKDNGFVKENGAVYFTSLYDNWDHASGTRTSGYRFSAGFVPEFNYTRNSSDTESNSVNRHYTSSVDYLNGVGVNSTFSEDLSDRIENVSSIYRSSKTGLFGIVRFEHEKPINLYLQGNFGSSLLFGRSDLESEWENDRTTSSDYTNIYENDTFADSTYSHFESDSLYTTEINTEKDYLEATLSYTLRYYPNTRTDLGLRFTGIYRSSESTTSEDKKNRANVKDESFTMSLNSDMNYYFSPQLRLNGYISVNYNNILKNSEDSDTKTETGSEGFSARYGIGLNYYMF